ncbi:MAG: isocitrate lyase/phosphoenolpyruvate mutase family protein [Deltaproteobacteria bacterium]|nr:isocitrate lyase/phosphoenolpyruvate mutase family protein [Deltaproteobacteria bacterium]
MTAVETFRALHRSGCFVMPNPWDVGSAVLLHRAGFPAIASSSAALAFTRAMPDTVWGVPVDAVLAHLAELVRATPLPVNADFQSGFAPELEQMASNIARCVHTGVAGLSIEDATGDAVAPLYGRDHAIARVRSARRAIAGTGIPVVLTARCEAFLVNDPDAERTVLDRLTAFAAAGADCVFAPGIRDLAFVDTLVKAVAPTPVNVLISTPIPGFTVDALRTLGVRRISLGSALARVAWGAVLRSVREIAEHGTFETLAGAASFAELDTAFTAPRS